MPAWEPDLKFCPQCQRIWKKDKTVCSNCGAELDDLFYIAPEGYTRVARKRDDEKDKKK